MPFSIFKSEIFWILVLNSACDEEVMNIMKFKDNLICRWVMGSNPLTTL